MIRIRALLFDTFFRTSGTSNKAAVVFVPPPISGVERSDVRTSVSLVVLWKRMVALSEYEIAATL